MSQRFTFPRESRILTGAAKVTDKAISNSRATRASFLFSKASMFNLRPA